MEELYLVGQWKELLIIMSKIDTDELGTTIAEVLSLISEEEKNNSIVSEIMEEPHKEIYDNLSDLIHSIAIQASKQKVDLISSDDPFTKTVGWADLNSEKFWIIETKNLVKDNALRESHFKNRDILAKAIETICNAY